MRKGQALVELLLAIALTAIILPALITSFISARDNRGQQLKRVDAVNLLQATQEALRNVRESGWNNVVPTGTYYPQINSVNNKQWQLVYGTQTNVNGQGFTRSIDVIEVKRDSSGNIVTSGGTVDPSTKKIIITVSWTKPLTGSVSSTLYITRYLDSDAAIQTTVADFSAAGADLGVAPNAAQLITVAPTSDGDIRLGIAGHGDWCNPDQNLITPANIPITGQVKKVRAIPFEVFLSTGNNNAGPIYVDMTLSNPAYPTPPTASVRGVYYSVSNLTTNGLWGNANNVFLATSDDVGEMYVINVLTPTPGSPPTFALASIYNSAPGTATDNARDAADVFVYNNRAFIAHWSYLVILDVTDPTNPKYLTQFRPPQGNILRVTVNGKYAYLGMASAGEEIEVVDVSGLDTPTIAPSSAVATPFYAAADDITSSDGTDIVINPADSRIYMTFTQPDRSTNCLSGNGATPATTAAPASSITPAVPAVTQQIRGCEFMTLDLTNKSEWGTPAVRPTVNPGTATINPFPSVPVIGGWDAGMVQDLNGLALAYDYLENDPSTYPTPTTHIILGGKVVTPTPGTTPLVTLINQKEYTVLDMSDEKFPKRCASLDFDNGILGIAGVKEPDSDAFAYLATGDTTNNFKIIQGGPGLYGNTATFTSAPITLGSAYNRFVANIVKVAGQNDVQIKVAVADQVSGSCVHNNYTYVGTDGTTAGPAFTSTDNTTIKGVIPYVNTAPYYKNPAQCMRYQVTLTRNSGASSPTFKDISVYYTQ